MKNNTKVQALLSVNPSFNFDFISDHVYSHCLNREYVLTEPKTETKAKDAHSAAKDRYRYQKSQPASSEVKFSRPSRELLQPLSVPRLRQKAYSCYKIRASSMAKKDANRVSEFAIDSKLQGNHVIIRHYRRWQNNR